MKTWIKFCGTTSLDDALASIDAGADALGFIFAPSKRRVTVEQTREIIRALPPTIERIGVFLDADAEQIRATVKEANLTGIQLHDAQVAIEGFDRRFPESSNKLRIIRTVLVGDSFSRTLDGLVADTSVDAWLLDSGAGSGKIFDWQSARAQLGARQGRFIIAGGLNTKNVGEAMKVFTPWGVDVVSGIERDPGRKDPEKMRAFVAAVRKAEQQ